MFVRKDRNINVLIFLRTYLITGTVSSYPIHVTVTFVEIFNSFLSSATAELELPLHTSM